MCVAVESSIILSVHDVTTPNTALQVRTSYVPQEILWGYRFEHKCVAYDKAMNKYAVSYTAINSFIPDRTPRWVLMKNCRLLQGEPKKRTFSKHNRFS